jgi:hypothetical protein
MLGSIKSLLSVEQSLSAQASVSPKSTGGASSMDCSSLASAASSDSLRPDSEPGAAIAAEVSSRESSLLL